MGWADLGVTVVPSWDSDGTLAAEVEEDGVEN